MSIQLSTIWPAILLISQLTLSSIECVPGNAAEPPLLARLPRNKLLRYIAYKDVSILHYSLPAQTSKAFFSFTAVTEGSSSCTAHNVTVHMKPGSYPVISPEGVKFPDSFMPVDRRLQSYELSFPADGKTHWLNLTTPVTGDWFGVAFQSWTDPKLDKIEQQGLGPRCDTYMSSTLRAFLDNYSPRLVPDIVYDLASVPGEKQTLRFHVPHETRSAALRFRPYDRLDPSGMGTGLRGESAGEEDNATVLYKVSGPGITRSGSAPLRHNGSIEVELAPSRDAWHYMEISLPPESRADVVDYRLELELRGDDTGKFESPLLIRQSYPEFFTFDYDLHPLANGSTPATLTLDSHKPASLTFPLERVQDIGGTLVIGMGLKPSVDEHKKGESKTKVSYRSVKVIVCIGLNVQPVPSHSNSCYHGEVNKTADMVLNTTETMGVVNIPFPEPGAWFVTAAVYCLEAADDGKTSKGNQTPTLLPAECKQDVVFSVNSSPCVGGGCSEYGKCYHYMSGGFVYSTCICWKGYSGWDCSDDSSVPSSWLLLLQTLCLTLSNLMFLVSVVFAIRRKHYPQAFVYAATMIFSALYHACDSGEDEYSFCLMRLSAMQFADFYCGLLSIWITLLAIANIKDGLALLLHTGASIIFAVCTELDKHALWVFLLSALSGLTVVLVSWGLHYRREKRLYPTRRYLILYMPLGLVITGVGLICYAFLQTNKNYYIVHSIWHMIMAIGVVLLLPDRTTFMKKSGTDNRLFENDSPVSTTTTGGVLIGVDNSIPHV